MHVRVHTSGKYKKYIPYNSEEHQQEKFALFSCLWAVLLKDGLQIRQGEVSIHFLLTGPPISLSYSHHPPLCEVPSKHAKHKQNT